MRTTGKTMLGLAALFLMTVWPICAVFAEPLGATYADIVAGARREGKLVVWAYLPSQPATHRAVIDAFNKRFGLNTKLEWVPMAGPTANTRVIAEAAGRQISVDIIGGGSIGEVIGANNAKIIKPYDWDGVFGKEFPKMAEVENNIVPELKGTALTYLQAHYVIAWNPNFIDGADVPSTIQGMADPKWSGKFGLNAFFLVPLDVLGLAIGKEKALALADQLIANNPVLGKGSGAVNQSITTGQVPFGLTLSLLADNSIRKGEPLKFKMASDYILLSDVMLWVPENSPNPNTARLFAAWFSAEGYAVANQFEPIPSSWDPDNVFSKMAKQQVAETGAKEVKVKTLADADQLQAIRDAITLKLSGQQ